MNYFCVQCGQSFQKGFPVCECNRRVFVSVNIQADSVKDALMALWKAYKEVHRNQKSLNVCFSVANKKSILAVEAYDETRA